MRGRRARGRRERDRDARGGCGEGASCKGGGETHPEGARAGREQQAEAAGAGRREGQRRREARGETARGGGRTLQGQARARERRAALRRRARKAIWILKGGPGDGPVRKDGAGHAHPSSAGPPAGPREPGQHGVWRHWAHTVETRRETVTSPTEAQLLLRSPRQSLPPGKRSSDRKARGGPCRGPGGEPHPSGAGGGAPRAPAQLGLSRALTSPPNACGQSNRTGTVTATAPGFEQHPAPPVQSSQPQSWREGMGLGNSRRPCCPAGTRTPGPSLARPALGAHGRQPFRPFRSADVPRVATSSPRDGFPVTACQVAGGSRAAS
ncbi:homeobox protein cut-like 1 [Kogia breviceps]|uniref:homeobox protein cut-like 1 n=1 Tax=Kogia breviceps TaxID=27615 RepID=UPI0034D2E223